MPQFDTIHYSSLIFWMFVNCALLIGVMVGYYIPKFGLILSNRKTKLQEIADKNQLLQSQIDMLEKEYLAEISKVQEDSIAIINDNKKSIKDRFRNQLAMLDEEFRNEIKALHSLQQKQKAELELDMDSLTKEATALIIAKLTEKV